MGVKRGSPPITCRFGKLKLVGGRTGLGRRTVGGPPSDIGRATFVSRPRTGTGTAEVMQEVGSAEHTGGELDRGRFSWSIT